MFCIYWGRSTSFISHLLRHLLRHLFLLLYSYIREVPTKHPREKILNPRNTHKKNFRPAKYPREKNWEPRRHGGTKALSSRDSQWQETNGTYHTQPAVKIGVKKLCEICHMDLVLSLLFILLLSLTCNICF